MEKSIKKCEYCGKEMKMAIKGQKYCNYLCAGKGRNEKLVKKKKERKKKKEKTTKTSNLSIDVKNLEPIQEINVVGRQKLIGREIPIIEGGFGEGKRCLTDKAIAEIHNTEAREIRRLIKDNLKRFKNNVDFIDLKGVGDTHTLINMGYAKQSITQAEHIYLLSERGYAKLIKIMDTDLAWEIHDELIDRYFSIRKELKETTIPKLTKEQELATIIVMGGIGAIEASKELAELERKKAEEAAENEKRLLELEHEREMIKERSSRNQMIGVTTMVETLKDILGIQDLNSMLFNRWLAEEKKLGEYIKYPGEKKRRFEPNEDFFRWVSLEGYSFTGKTRDGRKTNVQYSTAMVERIVEHHAGSLIKFVKINTTIKKSKLANEQCEFEI